MKKIFIAMAAIAFTTAAKSQVTYSAGLEVGFPSGDLSSTSKTGFGASAKAVFPIAKNSSSAITGSVGVLSFAGKSLDFFGMAIDVPTITSIPIKAGYRYKTRDGLYFEPQLGLTFFSAGSESESKDNAFTLAGGFGVEIKNKVDISARYESSTKNGESISFIGLRLAYIFN